MPASSRRPTLHDVAALAGVSHMTVSRALRTPHLVSTQTAETIRKAIRKLDYRPDPTLSALAAYRTKAGGRVQGDRLAFLDCDQSAYSQVVLEGARQEASLLGYGVDSFHLEPTFEAQQQLSRMLFHRGMRGLMFGPSDSLLTFSGWDWEQFAAVSLGALEHQPPLHAIAMDYFHGARRGFEILSEQGCRRIGFLVDPKLESRTGNRWRGGYLAMGGTRRWIYPHTSRSPRVVKQWLRDTGVDGLLTIHPEIQSWLQRLDLKIAYLNDNGTRAVFPRLTLNPQTIGAEAVRLLHHLLLRREFGLPQEPRMVALQGTWAM